jgi:hypothetical protein
VRGKLTDLVREDEGVEVVEEERDDDEDREILNPSHLDHLRDCGRVSAERDREIERQRDVNRGSSRVGEGNDRQERLQRDSKGDGDIAEIRRHRAHGSVELVVLMERDGDWDKWVREGEGGGITISGRCLGKESGKGYSWSGERIRESGEESIVIWIGREKSSRGSVILRSRSRRHERLPSTSNERTGLSDDNISIHIDLTHALTSTPYADMTHCIIEISCLLLEFDLTEDESIQGGDALVVTERDEKIDLEAISESIFILINLQALDCGGPQGARIQLIDSWWCAPKQAHGGPVADKDKRDIRERGQERGQERQRDRGDSRGWGDSPIAIHTKNRLVGILIRGLLVHDIDFQPKGYRIESWVADRWLIVTWGVVCNE